MFKRPLGVAAALTALALIAAACSSNSSTPSTTQPTFTGANVVVGQIIPLTGAALQLTQSGEAMKAAVNYYNSQGGLQGHKLVLDQCDTQDSATVEAQCAQKLVNDHAVADIGGDTNFNVTAVQPTLTAASIARIGLLMGSVTEYTAKTNYAIEPGMILMLGGMLTQLIRHGCKTMNMVTVDSPSAGQLKALLGPIATQAGGTLVNVILVPGTATDYTQYVTSAGSGGACGAGIALGSDQANAFTASYNQVKPSYKLSYSSGTYSSTDLSKLGTAATTAVFTYGVPGADDPKVPGLSNVMNILKGGGSSITASTAQGQAIIPVMAMHAFMVEASAIKGDITAASVNSAMAAATNIPMWGVTPPWSPGKFVAVGGPFGAVFANVSNPMLWDEQWNKTWTSNGQFNILADVPGSGVTG